MQGNTIEVGIWNVTTFDGKRVENKKKVEHYKNRYSTDGKGFNRNIANEYDLIVLKQQNKERVAKTGKIITLAIFGKSDQEYVHIL